MLCSNIRLNQSPPWITEDLNTLPQTKKAWKGLKSVGMAERTCETADKSTVERRFFYVQFQPKLMFLQVQYGVIGALKILCTGAWMLHLKKMQAVFVKAMRQLL